MAVIFLAGLAPDDAVAQAALTSNEWTRAAEMFVRHLESKRFDSAAAWMQPGPAAEALSATKLNEVWTQVVGQVGELQSVTPSTIADQDSMKVVDLSAQFARAALVIRVVLTPGKKVAGLWFRAPTPPAYEPPAYVDTTRFGEAEVTFGREPWRLPGVLALPRGVAKAPAVVLVGGSGPVDRDLTLGPTRTYRDLGWGLASRGIAVLRYDKRTRAHGARIDVKSMTVEEEVIEDALAALEFVRAHEGVDASRVMLAGHSLGGVLAPEIAARDGRVAGVIVMAAPARAMGEVLVDQLAYVASLGAGDAAGKAQLAALLDSAELLRRHELPPEATVLGAPASYMYDLEKRDVRRSAVALRVPILILQGGRDYQSTMQDFRLWEEALSGHGNATLLDFPQLNHVFVRGEGKAVPEEYMAPGHLDGAVVEAIAAWAAARIKGH